MPERQKRASHPLELELTGGFQLPCGCWEPLEEQLVLSPHAVWLLAYDARYPDTQYHMLDSHVFVREGDLNSDVCCIYCFFGCGGGGGGVISVKKKQESLVGNYF